MNDIAAWFEQGGVWFQVIAALDAIGSCVVLVSLILAAVARFAGKIPGVARVVAILALIGCIVPFCAGLGGYTYSKSAASSAIESADPNYQEDLENAAHEQAKVPLQFGGCSSLCCAVPAFIAILFLPRRKRGWEAALEEESTNL